MKTLTRHYVLSHKKIRYWCFFCHLKFADIDLYNDHLKEHWDTAEFKCNDCDTAYKLKSRIVRHANWHFHPNFYDSSQCELCSKYFRKHEMASHMKRHAECQATLRCGDCPNVLKTPNALKAHKVFVHGFFPCKLCNYVTDDYHALYGHQKNNHSYEELNKQQPAVLIECKVCNLVYGSELRFQQHVAAKHPNGKWEKLRHDRAEIKCSVCGDAKPAIKILNDHIKYNHLKYDVVKTIFYECKLCRCVYDTAERFKRHARIIHPGQRSEMLKQERNKIACFYCGKVYRCDLSLNRHVRSVHPIRVENHTATYIECLLCYNVYDNDRSFAIHSKRMHQTKSSTDLFVIKSELKCSICGKVKKSCRSLNEHVMLHNKD